MPPTSRRAQITEDLRGLITTGEIPQGGKLPTEAELAERYGVGRNTARDAMQDLVGSGLVVARRPLGYFVRERTFYRYRPQSESKGQPVTPEMDRFLAEVTADGHTASQDIQVSIVKPPPEVVERLGITDGVPVVVRLRVRHINGEPQNTNDSYYRMADVGGSEILNPADVARGCNQVLRELGHGLDRALDEIYVRMPTPDEARRLDLPAATPVGVHIRTGFTEDGRAVVCTTNVLPGDRHVIVYERHWRTTETGPAGAAVGR